MHAFSSANSEYTHSLIEDEYLFGRDPLPGIVSVWASRDGRAVVWRRSARDGRFLERALLKGASQRLGRQIKNLGELATTYYQVGPVEQYLMQTGRVYFLGLNFEDLHRLQFDLETTSLDPHRGRIFLIAVRDSRGFATTLEAPSPDDEAEMITKLCQIVRDRDPDIVENHNLFSFDLQFLEYRAEAVCSDNNVLYQTIKS